MDRALEWAHRITANAPVAVQATKESVLRGLAGTLDDAYGIEQKLSSMVFATEDAKEGPKAFKEKRDPTGRASDRPRTGGGVSVDPRQPCLIGVGQRTWHLAGDEQAPEPLAMLDEVVRPALADCGATGDVARRRREPATSSTA